MSQLLQELANSRWFVSVAAPVVLLGVLIFVHELGHFLVAKLAGVGVEKFSFGFGPRIWGVQVGETEYRISWIPLGGYVKMIGDDPFEEPDPELNARSFLQKPVWRRLAIVLAGPVFNLILPVLLFAGIYIYGCPEPTTFIGSVTPDSPAERAGMQAGDVVLAVGERKVTFYDELMEAITDLPLGATTELTVKRGTQTLTVPVSLKVEQQLNAWGAVRDVNVLGADARASQPVLGVQATPTSPAYQAGLRTGNLLVKVNDQPVKTWLEVLQQVSLAGNAPLNVTYKADRDRPDTKTATITPADYQLEPAAGGTLQALAAGTLSASQPGARYGLFPQEVFVSELVPDKPAAKAGLQPGDQLVRIDGTWIRHWGDITGLIGKVDETPRKVLVGRRGQLLELTIQPEIVTNPTYAGNRVKVAIIGIKQASSAYVQEATYQLGLLSALKRGFIETAQITVGSARLLLRVFTGDIPFAESLGGPISIISIAAQSAWSSIFRYLRVMAVISVSLGIINLLPIPLLDGGHIMFFAIEFIRGRPVSLRVREVSQQVGLIILFVLMAFALANDVRMTWLR